MSGRSGSAGPRPDRRFRLVLLGLAAAGMAAGLAGGLARLGWDVPGGASLAVIHGPLMVSGTLGAVIGLERAVALGGRWPYGAPLLAVLGSAALFAGLPVSVGAAAYLAAALVLIAASLRILIQQPADFTAALLVGALAWAIGDGLWLAGGTVPSLVGWWLAFLIFTIGGERLEMSRLLARGRAGIALIAVAGALVLAGAAAGLTADGGARLFGAGLVGLAAWLLRHDIAVRTVRRPGATRFMAAAMLGGYAWLAVAGLVLLAALPGSLPFGYDAALHAVLIGFVLSMIFGHALIILPAVARLRLAWHPALYAPLALLHASMLLRLCGDVAGPARLRLASGPLTVAALAGFAAVLVYAGRRARSAPGAACRKPLANGTG